MKFKFKKKSLFLFLLLLLTSLVVKAGSTYTINLDPLKIDAFPRVQLTFTASENNLFAKNFLIKEDGEDNTGPIVVLSPKNTNNKIDLFLLIDTTGNTQKYKQIIQNNIQALVLYMKHKGVDGQIYIQTLSSSDSPQSINISQFALNDQALIDFIDNLTFDEQKKERTYGLEKIDNFAKTTARSGSEKILVIINGSQFSDIDKGDSTSYSLIETINSLGNSNFIVFALGNPIKQLHKSKSQPIEDGSMSHALSGGYLGAFSSDLTQIYDLLFKRTPQKYVLQYFSNKSVDTASSTGVEILINNFSTKTLSYSSVNRFEQEFAFAEVEDIYIGTDANISVVLTPYEKASNVLTVVYGTSESGYEEKELMLDREKSNDQYLAYTGKLKPEDYQKYSNLNSINYFSKLYTPDTYKTFTNGKMVLIIKYDSGIYLEGELVSANGSDQKILWKWSGKTVDLGTEFELWGGDNLITKTTNRQFQVPIDNSECNRYQVMKLKVKLPAGVDHPSAGGWSTFSLVAEKYMPARNADGINESEISETNGINLMLNCFDINKSTSEYTSTGSNKLNLDTVLKYLTDVKYKKDEGTRNNRFIYILMKYISGQTVKTMSSGGFVDTDGDLKNYPNEGTNIKREMVYKLITNANQTIDFTNTFSDAIQELIDRMSGNISI